MDVKKMFQFETHFTTSHHILSGSGAHDKTRNKLRPLGKYSSKSSSNSQLAVPCCRQPEGWQGQESPAPNQSHFWGFNNHVDLLGFSSPGSHQTLMSIRSPRGLQEMGIFTLTQHTRNQRPRFALLPPKVVLRVGFG